MRTCASCTHRVEATRNFGAPSCGKYGYPLSYGQGDTESEGRFAASFASDCKSYTEALTIDPQKGEPTLIIGASPDLFVAATSGMNDRLEPSICVDCKYHVPASVVSREIGFQYGLCGATATLVPPQFIVEKARSCPVGDRGPERTSTDGLILDKHYTETAVSIGGSSGPRLYENYDPSSHTLTDPRNYPTDREVTPHESKMGIRGWRKVMHPRGTKPPVFMPIFDWQKLGLETDPRETYGSHSPELYIDYSGNLYKFAFANCQEIAGMDQPDAPEDFFNKTLCLIGEAGTGKTEFWCWVAWLMDLPFHRISFRPTTDQSEIFGAPALVVDTATGQTVTDFKFGRFSLHYEHPCVICLDELNAAPDDTWYLFRPVLDNASQLVIESENKMFERDPFCFIGMAMNPPGSSYRGTRVLSPADRRRFLSSMVDYPTGEDERKIIQMHCAKSGFQLADSELAVIMNVSDSLRSMYRDNVSTFPWGVSSNVDVALLTPGFELEECYRAVVTDGLPQAQGEIIISQVRELMGE